MRLNIQPSSPKKYGASVQAANKGPCHAITTSRRPRRRPIPTRPAGFRGVAALAVLGLWLSRPTSSLLAANFSRLKPGLTRAEVERLLGGPPGDYGRYAGGVIDYGDGSVLQVFAAPGAGDAKPDTWTDDANHFYVFFDSRGEVVAGSRQTRFLRSPKGWLATLSEVVRRVF